MSSACQNISQSRFQARQIFHLLLVFCFLSSQVSGQESLSLTNVFPTAETVFEFVTLSDAIYSVKSCDSENIPSDLNCHMYEEPKSKTQVMVVSSDLKKYVAVCYAGTDNPEDVIHDVDIAMTAFGPEKNPINKDVGVHKGFNHAVFSYGLYDRVLETISSVLKQHPEYQLITTGHSLGAADSILTGVAFAEQFPDREIMSYNFGCPRTGDTAWKEYVNEIKNLGIWRYVYEADPVARIPFIRFEHVGHTVEFYKKHAYAFYLHNGDKELHYAGVPPEWSSVPFLDPLALGHHSMSNYVRYIEKKSLTKPDTYWVEKFISTKDDILISHENELEDWLVDIKLN